MTKSSAEESGKPRWKVERVSRISSGEKWTMHRLVVSLWLKGGSPLSKSEDPDYLLFFRKTTSTTPSHTVQDIERLRDASSTTASSSSAAWCHGWSSSASSTSSRRSSCPSACWGRQQRRTSIRYPQRQSSQKSCYQ